MILLKFNGMMETTRKGCGPCGKGTSEKGFVTHKLFFLPSGAEKTFRIGKAEWVDDKDGEFLLSYQYTDSFGVVRDVFEEV